jgi:hypothetical protein
MVHCTANFAWRKVKTCWFGWVKWFWASVFAQDAEGGKRHSEGPCCWLARWFDWSRRVAISSLRPFAVPVLVFMGEVGKK